MANVIIEHEDGRSYSTTHEGFKALYEPEGFQIVGDETDASFEPVGIPRQKAPRRSPRPKAATRKAKAAPPPPESTDAAGA